MPGLPEFEARLGYTFKSRDLLVRALTHKSSSAEKSTAVDNEQLEFLGDSILGFLVSDCLVQRLSAYPEGRLSKIKAQLVSATRLHEAAQALDLGEVLQLGRGEEMSGGRTKKALLANAIEAIIAAIYLDSGIEAAKDFVLRHIVGEGELRESTESHQVDYKGALQEKAQALRLAQPRYAIVGESGPPHERIFVVETRVGTQLSARGEGASKKAAGQQAARVILEQLDATSKDPESAAIRAE